MSIITFAIGFIIYFILGTITVYFLTDGEDRSYDNSFQGLFAILLWPYIMVYVLIYKSFQKLKQLFITLTNLKNKQK